MIRNLVIQQWRIYISHRWTSWRDSPSSMTTDRMLFCVLFTANAALAGIVVLILLPILMASSVCL